MVRSVGVSEDDGGGQDASAWTGSGPSSVAVHAPTQGMTSVDVGTSSHCCLEKEVNWFKYSERRKPASNPGGINLSIRDLDQIS